MSPFADGVRPLKPVAHHGINPGRSIPPTESKVLHVPLDEHPDGGHGRRFCTRPGVSAWTGTGCSVSSRGVAGGWNLSLDI